MALRSRSLAIVRVFEKGEGLGASATLFIVCISIYVAQYRGGWTGERRVVAVKYSRERGARGVARVACFQRTWRFHVVRA